MVAYTNTAREIIKEKALEAFRALANLKPSDDGLSAEQILDTMWCLRTLMEECDSEIRRENIKEQKARRNK